MLVVAVLAAAVVAALALGAGPSLVLLLQTGGSAVLDWGTTVVRSVVG